MLTASVAAFWLLAARAAFGQQTGFNTDEPRWCGKVYEPGFPSFNPGGQTYEPAVAAGGPLLYVQVQPRYSLYVDSEKEGQFIVNAALSPWYGLPLPDTASSSSTDAKLDFMIRLSPTGPTLVKDSVDLNSTENLFTFDLTSLTPSMQPYNVTLTAALEGNCGTKYTAATQLFYLPDKAPNGGSVTKIDNLYGGLLFKNTASGGAFAPLFPYGFYASCDGFFCATNYTAEIEQYAGWGLNAMTPLSQYPTSADSFALMDELDIKFQYDLREQYKNLTWVAQNVAAARDNEAIFSYWSADEPDGNQDPFNATVLAHGVIRGLDPYHPVAVVLNCQNYYFGPYTDGADIIMEDVYPIGINSTFSKWGTVCNATLGDCGCDNCEGGPHAVQDVRDRLDDLATYERWLGRWPKMKIHNPQSFHGEGYWSRDPYPAEEWAMALIAVNHGAQAIISWVYPDTDVLSVAHGALAKVLTASPVVDFVVANDRPHPVPVAASADVDVAYWVRGGEMLVSVVNGGYDDVAAAVEVDLPGNISAASIESVPWGNLTWTLSGSKLSTPGVPALGTSLVILKLE